MLLGDFLSLQVKFVYIGLDISYWRFHKKVKSTYWWCRIPYSWPKPVFIMSNFIPWDESKRFQFKKTVKKLNSKEISTRLLKIKVVHSRPIYRYYTVLADCSRMRKSIGHIIISMEKLSPFSTSHPIYMEKLEGTSRSKWTAWEILSAQS